MSETENQRAARVAREAAAAEAAKREAAALAVQRAAAVAQSVEGKKGIREELIGMETAESLDKLKGKITAETMGVFIQALSLKGKSFEGTIPRNLNVLAQKDEFFLPRLMSELNKLNESALTDVSKVLDDSLGESVDNDKNKDFLAQVYSTAILLGAKDAFLNAYPRYNDFVAKYPKEYGIGFNVSVNGFNDFTYTFPENPKFVEDYNKFAADNAAPAVDQAKIDAENTDIAAKARELEATWVGKILMSMGIISKENGGAEAVISGKNWLGVFIVGVFGGKQFVGEHYDSMVSGFDPKYRVMVEQAENTAQQYMSLDPERLAKRKADISNEGLKPLNLASLISKNSSIPKSGMKLTEAFTTGGTNWGILALKIGKGGRLVLPKNAHLRINGNDVVVNEEIGITYDSTSSILKEGLLNIVGTLPVGTVIAGEVAYSEGKETA